MATLILVIFGNMDAAVSALLDLLAIIGPLGAIGATRRKYQAIQPVAGNYTCFLYKVIKIKPSGWPDGNKCMKLIKFQT